MKRLCVIDAPGLTRELLSHVPVNAALGRWISRQRVAVLTPTWPAVTCSMQATITTGGSPSKHGIVANGVATFRSREDQALIDASNFASYRRDVSFWEQSNQLLDVPRFWQDLSGKSKLRTALLFFQNSMPGFASVPKPAADIVITPKPEHGTDGKITSLLWTEPRDLQGRLFAELGAFPLVNYWGPLAGIASSQWIAKSAAWVWTHLRPELQLVYVPHLDYDLQRFGPSSPQAARAVVDVASALEPLLEAVLPDGEIVLFSEYAMEAVTGCAQPNRLLKQAGLLQTRDTTDGQLVDYEKSRAFAMVDHQIAHLYTSDVPAARQVLRDQPVRFLEPREQIRHRRAGELQIEALAGAWMDYRWWDPPRGPVFSSQVDIHRKPGYDALELFFDPATNGVSQNVGLIRGSHGRVTLGDTLIAGSSERVLVDTLAAEQVAGLIVG
jgi:predicted AlkP superfamily pyrophosphatase or phosphodiesterase